MCSLIETQEVGVEREMVCTLGMGGGGGEGGREHTLVPTTTPLL